MARASTRAQTRSSEGPSLRDEARALFRSTVLRAAEEVFAARGYHGTRIQDIAERARVAVGTVYNYFKEKDEILQAILREHGEQMVREFQSQPGDPEDFEGEFRARTTRIFRYMAMHRAFLAISAEHGYFELKSCRNRKETIELKMEEQMGEMLRKGIEQGALMSEDLGRLRAVFGGAGHAIINRALHDSSLDLEAEARYAMEFFLRGARKNSDR